MDNICDARTASNVALVTDAQVSDLGKLRPVSYTEKNGKARYGLLAQDVQQAIPSAVYYEGNSFAVRYRDLLTLLIAKVNALEGAQSTASSSGPAQDDVVAARLQSLEEGLAQAHAEIQRLQARLGQASADSVSSVEKVSVEIGQIKSRLGEVEAAQSKVNAKASSIESQIVKLDKKVKEIGSSA